MHNKKKINPTEYKSFWQHLDDLRSSIIKILGAIVVLAIVAFCFKDLLFDFVLAPKNPDFFTYSLIEKLSLILGVDDYADGFSVSLINTELSRQFLIHIRIAFIAGVFLASPYIIFKIFQFVNPALYPSEKKITIKITSVAYIMFMLGAATAYLIIFPFTFRFLASYQVSPDIPNLITLDSYIDTLLMLSLLMGIIFELPILAAMFAKIGIINARILSRYRRHAIVAILIVAAIITPTSDPFTLTLTSLPIYLLFELSILLIRRKS